MKDLVVLVADKNSHFAVRGALSRPKALGICPIDSEFRVHPLRDGGVRTTGPAVLATERAGFRHALMLLDLEGCGASLSDPIALEQELDRELQPAWGEDARTIVIAPELDAWVWGVDNVLQQVLKWPLDTPVREWLQLKGFAIGADGKPTRPKEAMEALRAIHKQPRSSALYEQITKQVSLQRCSDPAFLRAREQLKVWFPP